LGGNGKKQQLLCILVYDWFDQVSFSDFDKPEKEHPERQSDVIVVL